MAIIKKKKKQEEDIAPVKSNSNATSNSNVLDKARDIIGGVIQAKNTIENTLNPIKRISTEQAQKGQNVATKILNGETNFFKESKSAQEIKDIWSDGFQRGDVKKTIGSVNKTMAGTVGDATINILKGNLQTAEGLVDFGRYNVADVLDYIGNSNSKTVLGTTGNILADQMREKAKENTTEKFFSSNKDINTLKYGAATILDETIGKINPATSAITQKIKNDAYNAENKDWAKQVDEYSIFDSTMDQINQSVGQQSFRVGLAHAIGGTGASPGTTKALNQLEIFAGSYGSAKSDALNQGASMRDATIRGFISGTSELISENLFDSLPGFKTYEVGGVSKLKDLIGKSAEKAFGGNAGKAAIRIFGGLGEGVEEILSNGLETAFTDIANLVVPVFSEEGYTYGMEEGQGVTDFTKPYSGVLKIFKDIYKSGTSKESKEAFITALFSTLITCGISSSMNESQRKEVIQDYAKDNNISVEKATELFDAVRDLKVNEIANEDTSYSEKVELGDQVSQQLVNEINESKKTDQKTNLEQIKNYLTYKDTVIDAIGQNHNLSSEGLDLVDSYRAYNGKTKNTTEIAQVQKYFDNRGIYGREDASAFIGSNETAKWINENGQRTVLINPNATTDQIIQNIATHEMTHDIMSNKTDTNQEMFNSVLDYAKTQENYKEMRANLEKAYSEYYKNKSQQEFSQMIDEEIVANTLGEHLGTQEYVNRIVNQNPSLAQNIYNWVVDKLQNYNKNTNNKGEVIGYKSDRLYWESVKNRFEKAYNEQKTTNAINNTDDERYSIVGIEGINELPESKLKRNMLKNYNKALNMQKNNKSNDDIYNNTKFYIGTDGKLRTEISDDMFEVKIKSNLKDGQTYKMEDFIDDDYLFDFYPQLRNYDVKITDYDDGFVINTIKYVLNGFKTKNPNGHYDSTTKAIYLNENVNREDAIKQTMIHEIQHAIQDIEKFENGTNSLLSRENYIKSSGENEAKLTAKRLDLDREQRQEKPFYSEQEKQTNKRLNKYYADRNIFDKIKDNIYNYFEEKIKNENPKSNGYEIQEENTGNQRLVYENRIKDVDNTSFSLQENNQNNETRYSLSTNKDTDGDLLTKGQQEYFKDSKVVDSNGNLMVVYHGSRNEYTTYEGGGFFTDDYWNADGYASGEVVDAVYLNMKRPLMLECEGRKWDDLDTPYGTSTREIAGYVESSNEYDGVIFNNIADSWMDDVEAGTSTVYYIKDSNQAKRIDNENPTSNIDTRYSLADNNIVYRAGTQTGQMESGTFFAADKTDADNYGNSTEYHIDKSANLYNGISSKEYAEQNNLMNVKNDVLKDKLGVDTLQEIEDIHYNWTTPSYLDINPNLYHFAYQYMAKNDLESKGYDGAIWTHEDDLTPQQYQIWNNDKVNNDTRYSLTTNKDSNGKTLTKEQANYFKNTKIVDNEGNLLEVYRGEPTTGKTTYESRKGGGNKEINEYGIYFTNSKDFAKDFAFERISDPDDIFFAKKGKEGEVKSAYLNITNPLDLGNLTEEEIKSLYPYESSMAKQLFDEDKFVSDMLHFQEIGNHQLMKSYLDMKEIADNTDYDGLIAKLNVQGNELEYAVFNSNQIKSTDNTNPTDNPDIRYSLGTNKEIDNNNIAPIREDISDLSEQVNNLSKQLETLQNQSEIAPRKGYVEQFRQQRYENQDYTPMTQEDADLYQQSLLNDEAYLKSLDEQAESVEGNTRIINRITNDVQNQLGLSTKQKNTLSDIVRNAIENEYTSDEIARDLEKNFGKQEYTYPNEDAREVKKLIRNTPIKVSDGIKTDIPDYNSFQKSNFNKITFSRNGVPVDVAYQALNEQMPVYFPNDITNPTDQLMKIAEVANVMSDITETVEIPSEQFDNIADYIRNSYLEDKYNSQMNGEASLNKDIQFNMTDEILPTTIRSQESIDNYIDNRDIAPVRETTPIKSQQTTNKEKATRMGRSFQEMFINRNYVIDQYAKATGNKYIKFAGDDLNNVSGEAQYNINNKQTDFNGNWIGKGVHEIFEPARQAGLYEAFNDYLIQKSNIERHSLGKGSQVPLAVSQELVSQYESENPQFKEWAKDVYTYFDNVLQEQVDAGLITQEQYDTFRGENGIYRSYVPFYEGDIDKSRYFDNEGNIKAVSTLKRAKGGATDVSQMLAVEDSMARQTFSYKKAIRQNELYKQIVSTQQKYENLMDQDVRSNPTDLEDSLFITPDGERIVTAYVDGNRVSAQISEDLFNELTKENENRVRQFEEDYSLITNPLQKASNIRRNLITTWNPVFLARNAIKDIQDAAINSKHTGDMLKNYYGLNKTHTPALVELAQAKTNEAKQFLALYGAENLYGDYSDANGKGIIKSFSRANELIELSPRFAEFKASLQNGESVQEAIYNAREVTTNFGRGGYISKALNRNGFTFLNANIQGLDKVVRNLSGENGVKGVTSVVVKGAMFAVLPSIINHLMFGSGDDKDEEYEALPDYIKDNYYLIKLESGKFLRIPKGRINSVFGSAARRLIETFEGEENAFEGYGKNAWSQIGVGDSSGLQTIFTPLSEAFGSKNGTSWYGGDIVPTRLQNKPAAEQYDEKTDELSKFLGEKLNISPKKINYILDQYSGGIGDVLLPMMTPATTSGAETPLEYLVAPVEDTFIVNSTDDNKYAGEFYDLKDKLEVQHNSQYATDDDILKYKYMSNVSSQMSELYKEKREIQSSTVLSQKEKYAKVQAIQNEINTLAKNALNNYDNYTETENYASIGEFEYYKDNDGEWSKVLESDSEFTAGMTDSEKTSYFNVKNKINSINTTYNNNIKDITDESLKKQYQSQKKNEITQAIVNSGLDNYTKAMVYAKYYSSEKTMRNVVNSGYDVNTYITALYDIEEIRNKYSQANGYSTAERKARTIAYINSLQMNVPQKAMLIRTYYSSFKGYNGDIVNYVNNLDITVEEKKTILDDNGFKVDGNRISW